MTSFTASPNCFRNNKQKKVRFNRERGDARLGLGIPRFCSCYSMARNGKRRQDLKVPSVVATLAKANTGVFAGGLIRNPTNASPKHVAEMVADAIA